MLQVFSKFTKVNHKKYLPENIIWNLLHHCNITFKNILQINFKARLKWAEIFETKTATIYYLVYIFNSQIIDQIKCRLVAITARCHI